MCVVFACIWCGGGTLLSTPVKKNLAYPIRRTRYHTALSQLSQLSNKERNCTKRKRDIYGSCCFPSLLKVSSRWHENLRVPPASQDRRVVVFRESWISAGAERTNSGPFDSLTTQHSGKQNKYSKNSRTATTATVTKEDKRHVALHVSYLRLRGRFH